jgi:hypothetical protein
MASSEYTRVQRREHTFNYLHLWSFVGNVSTMTVSVQLRLPQAALALLASSFVAELGNQKVKIH